MTLADGATLINTGVNLTRTPIIGWDGISMYEILRDGLFVTIIAWFISRVIKGKSANPLKVESEEQELYNAGFGEEGRQTDSWTNMRGDLGSQSHLSETGIDHAHETTAAEARSDIETGLSD